MNFIRHIQLQLVRSRECSLFLASCFVILLTTSCVNDLEKVKQFDKQNLPDQTIKDANIHRSSQGRLQLVMEAPLIEMWDAPESKTEYRQGVKLQFFNGPNNPTALLTARYAISYDSRQEMLVRDSVVIIDLRSGDTNYLQDLVWNSLEHRIYSCHPVRSINGQRVTYGDAFESDDAFDAPQIVHQRGTIEWKEE